MIYAISGCKSQSIPSSEAKPDASKLVFNELYVYDNGSDTIIKNYSLFDSLRNSLPFPVDSNESENNYIPMPGSTFIMTLMFYNDSSGTIVGTKYRKWDQVINMHGRVRAEKDSSDYIKELKVSGNKISFKSGYRGEIESFYVGTINQDTLRLSIHFSQNDFPIQLISSFSDMNFILMKK